MLVLLALLIGGIYSGWAFKWSLGEMAAMMGILFIVWSLGYGVIVVAQAFRAVI
jgi:hypothetical protein